MDNRAAANEEKPLVEPPLSLPAIPTKATGGY
jgi:hypothetical protein